MSDKHYMALDVQNHYRQGADEPLHDRLTVRLMSLDSLDEQHPWKRAQIDLTVPLALELIGQLTRAVSDFCQRDDIREALRNTDPEKLNI